MGFKEQIVNDITAFINVEEFGEIVSIDGSNQSVIIDDDRLKKRTATEYGGLTTGMILYFVPVSVFTQKPKVGNSQIFKDRLMYIEDVKEDSGVYEIILTQNRGE